MPIWNYVCANGHPSEKIRRFERRDEPMTCTASIEDVDGWVCGATLERTLSPPHVEPDGMYSYAPNLGCPDRFERQRAAIKSGTKVIERRADVPREHRDGQLSTNRRG